MSSFGHVINFAISSTSLEILANNEGQNLFFFFFLKQYSWTIETPWERPRPSHEGSFLWVWVRKLNDYFLFPASELPLAHLLLVPNYCFWPFIRISTFHIWKYLSSSPCIRRDHHHLEILSLQLCRCWWLIPAKRSPVKFSSYAAYVSATA